MGRKQPNNQPDMPRPAPPKRGVDTMKADEYLAGLRDMIIEKDDQIRQLETKNKKLEHRADANQAHVKTLQEQLTKVKAITACATCWGTESIRKAPGGMGADLIPCPDCVPLNEVCETAVQKILNDHKPYTDGRPFCTNCEGKQHVQESPGSEIRKPCPDCVCKPCSGTGILADGTPCTEPYHLPTVGNFEVHKLIINGFDFSKCDWASLALAAAIDSHK